MSHLLSITTVPPEIAASRHRALSDRGCSECLLVEPASVTTESCIAVVPMPLRPCCTATAQRRPLIPRQAERPAQGLLVMESENSPNLSSIRCFRAPTPHYGICP